MRENFNKQITKIKILIGCFLGANVSYRYNYELIIINSYNDQNINY